MDIFIVNGLSGHQNVPESVFMSSERGDIFDYVHIDLFFQMHVNVKSILSSYILVDIIPFLWNSNKLESHFGTHFEGHFGFLSMLKKQKILYISTSGLIHTSYGYIFIIHLG